MLKSLFICLMAINAVTYANPIAPEGGVPIDTTDGSQVLPDVYKLCLFHEVIYESHLVILSSDANCSFNVADIEDTTSSISIHPENEPHNPDCFSEGYFQIY